MNRSTDQSLRSLLPTHNGAFPPQLSDLAGSLLAQSRQRVGTLKADEEIARPYACAHIACDRLKTVLNLPPIEPRPPIQPRLYKRLYAYLNTALPQALARPRDTVTATATAATPTRASQRPRPTPTRRPPAAAPTPARPDWPPAWLRPTLRFACSRLGHARLAPTVAAGLAAIRRITADHPDDREWLTAHATALTAALLYYCIVSWQAGPGAHTLAADSRTEKQRYQANERALLDAFRRAREGDVTPEGGGGWEEVGWQDLSRHSLRDALEVVSDRLWLQNDWFQDIQRLEGTDVDAAAAAAADDDDSADEADDHENDPRATHAWRADSMFQERYDLLSAARQQDYAAWKADVLQRVAAARPPTGPMHGQEATQA